MGQKVNPVSLRIGINKGWLSNWYNKKNYKAWLSEDIMIRNAIKKKFYYAGISSIVLERKSDHVHAVIHASRPGIIIGRKGGEIEKLKEYIKKFTNYEFSVDVKQVPMIDLDAQLIAENIALQLEKRVFYRKAMKRAVMLAKKNGAEGIKIACSGRLGGAEMRRREWIMEGRVPLHTLTADISYGFAESMTLAGVIGVKVWVCKSSNHNSAEHASATTKK